MLEFLEPPHKAFQNLRIPHTFKAMKSIMRNRMQRLETPSLEAFAKMCLTVRNHKDAHALWSDVCALHEGRKSEHEERYHLIMKKLNSFEMLPKECANEMYSRLNVLVEEVNGLGLTQMQPSDVVRKILSVLPIEKYGYIVTVLHQGDLSTATPT